MAAQELIDEAVALGEAGRLAEAEAILRRAIDADPASQLAHVNLGVALFKQDKTEESVDIFRRATQLDPARLDGHVGLSTALQRLNRVADAIAATRRALEVEPNNAETHCLLARQLLLSGDFKRGWAAFEWRWNGATALDGQHLRQLGKPPWNGSAAKGKVILLHHEQGFGDTIQFVRYATLVARRGAQIILQVPRPLFRLMRRMSDVHDVLATDMPLPHFHTYASIMSLPLLFNTMPKTIPAGAPYLFAQRGLADEWSRRVAGDGAKLRVGLVWAGRPTHADDRLRSIPPEAFAPLIDVEGVKFYSLQKRGADGPAARLAPDALRVADVSGELNDFADTAAVLEHMDLLVSVDTAVAHLAGAMGKPVWLMLPFSPDFRWMLDRDDTPWYPTMRLLRQKVPGDWGEVVARAVVDLRDLVRCK